MPDKEPGPREDLLLLLGIDLFVDEDLAADLPGRHIDQPCAVTGVCRRRHQCLRLKEERQVFAEQDILVEHDLPPRDAPAFALAPQHILALADQDVGLGLDPVAVDQKPAPRRHFVRLRDRRRRFDDLHIRDQVRDARHRLLGPMYPGLDLLDAPNERVLALVEPSDVLAFAGEFALFLAVFDIAPHRHPVAQIVREQCQPFVIAPLVQEFGLAVEKFGNLMGQQETRGPRIAVGHLRNSTPAIASSTRATTGKPSCPQPRACACLYSSDASTPSCTGAPTSRAKAQARSMSFATMSKVPPEVNARVNTERGILSKVRLCPALAGTISASTLRSMPAFFATSMPSSAAMKLV